ncbi:MAG: YncE family protein [Candidatus Acidiferrales bacterium]
MKTSIVTTFFACLFLLGGFQARAPQSSPTGDVPLVLKATIPLPGAKGRMDHMSVDVKGHRVFVSEIGNGGVEAIDIVTRKPLHLLTGFGEPQGNYFIPSTNRLFVASGDDGTVKIFDGTSYKLVATAKFTSDADDLRLDPRTQHVIVGYSGQKFRWGKAVPGPGREADGALGYVASDGDHQALLPVDAHPEAFEIEKNGTRVFVNVPDHHEIEVGDLTKHQVIARWRVSCTDNFPMALDEADHRLFIGCRIPPTMQVIATETGKLISSVDIPATSDDMFYDAARKRIYVLGGQGFVDVIAQKSPDHYTRIARVRAEVGSRTGLFVPELNELFVAVSQSTNHPPELLVFEVR